MIFQMFAVTVAFATLLASPGVHAAGTNAPKETIPPKGSFVCVDTMYCAPQKRSGETCVMDNECLSEICLGNKCIPGGGLDAGAPCMWDSDCMPGLACEDTRCH